MRQLLRPITKATTAKTIAAAPMKYHGDNVIRKANCSIHSRATKNAESIHFILEFKDSKI